MKGISKAAYWRQWFFFRTETDRMLAAFMLFSVVMITARILYTGGPNFVFLVWNLFLAYIPYVVTNWLQYQPGWVENKFKFAASFVCWLLFLPNSFYIITDLLYLTGNAGIMKWFDLTMIISFALNGLLLGILSIRQMEKIIELYLFGRTELFFIYPVMCLNALGVYIGRWLRFNSWDVITNPFQLLVDVADLLLHPLHNKPEWGMIGCFSVFMILLYLSIKKISKVIR